MGTVRTAKEKRSVAKDIRIKGAALHNLKNIDVVIPRNRLTVITGLSGSGKSSLAFDTLYAEGQRRYVESLSSYARQFMGRLEKPDVERIDGISPAVAIEQKVNTSNPRSTVGTATEIYDYLKLLYARIGRTISPLSGKEVKRHTVNDVLDFVNSKKQGTRLAFLTPLICPKGRSWAEHLEVIMKQGFARLMMGNEIFPISGVDPKDLEGKSKCSLVIDRVVIPDDPKDILMRVADSAQSAFFEGHGAMTVLEIDTGVRKSFSTRFEADGMSFVEPSEYLFSFNNPHGACPNCEGFGSIIGIDPALVIPNVEKSILDDAIVCWKGPKLSKWKQKIIQNAHYCDLPVHKPISELTEEQYGLLWSGCKHFRGLDAFFRYLERKSYKIQYRIMLARYRGRTQCPECGGGRLRKESGYVRVGGKSISELVRYDLEKLLGFFRSLKLSKHNRLAASRLLLEIEKRLDVLCRVGLPYLTLNRLSSSLSGGESQRINLATALGSSLVGSMYILDEPSIGLHPRDTENLIRVLRELVEMGNTVVVVEHDEDIIRCADYIIDIGPEAGKLGGEVVYQGLAKNIGKDSNGITARYLRGELEIRKPVTRRKGKGNLTVKGAAEHNLKQIDAPFKLNALNVVSGVSGSGKSTLVRDILAPLLQKKLGGYGKPVGRFSGISGALDAITSVEVVDQNPIGRSSRSNPVTYVKAFNDIRELFARQKISKMRGYKPGVFSFNTDGGRCDTCQGEGRVTIEMQFMADISLKCERCNGTRYKPEILDVNFKGRTITDVLDMTVEGAISFFMEEAGSTTLCANIATKLEPLKQVGLGYVQLGQSSSTLSGGEAQRIKLASFLGKGMGPHQKHIFFVFDEPTTGLHFHDIRKLLDSFELLLDRGHTIVVIEHNMEVVKCADHVIDLGPGAGKAGGNLVFSGTPEDLCGCSDSHTAEYLKRALAKPSGKVNND